MTTLQYRKPLLLLGTLLLLGLGRSAPAAVDMLQCQTTLDNVRASWTRGIGPVSPEALARREAALQRKAQWLETHQHLRLSPTVLDRELERIRRETRMPKRLQALFDALGNDPDALRECIARPAWIEQQWYNSHAPKAASTTSHPVSVGESPKAPSTVGEAAPIGATAPVQAAQALLGQWNLPRQTVEARSGHTMVWTGNEMIVWGGQNTLHGSSSPTYLNDGGRYDPVLNRWRYIPPTDVLAPRSSHSAVWTGSEMIVWGGYNNEQKSLADGARYDPVTDTWTRLPDSILEARNGHSAVWTGQKMIVWGGFYRNGATFDPQSNTWQAITTTGAPSERVWFSMDWTGQEMIVWGGKIDDGTGHYVPVNDGARYNPATDTWTPMSVTDAPVPDYFARGVWANGLWLVWGPEGSGRYDPATDTWTPISTENAPSPRYGFSTIWTGDRLFIWGGDTDFSLFGIQLTDTGALYDPATNTWEALPMDGAPLPGLGAKSVWTGNEVLLWGGLIELPYGGIMDTLTQASSFGGIFDPGQHQWRDLPADHQPTPLVGNTAVWTGREMLVWGGGTDDDGTPPLKVGARYDPVTDHWARITPEGAPEARRFYTPVWTGREMIVWGGQSYDLNRAVNDGARYDPITDTWTPMSLENAPSRRMNYSAIWTGEELIIWGGLSLSPLRDGARYDPVTDTWTAMAPPVDTNGQALSWGRMSHHALWTGQEMLVWGGSDENTETSFKVLRYTPSSDSWAISSSAFPFPTTPYGYSYAQVPVWTGQEMLVWGDRFQGARWNPATDSWTPISTENEPMRRDYHAALWTGREMIVWGGREIDTTNTLNTGGRYDPATDSWTPMSQENAPSPRYLFGAVWTGSEMLVWGGDRTDYHAHRYRPDDLPPPPPEYDLDIDGDGQYDALTDGMLVVRYLFGFRGTPLLKDALGTGCSRCDATAVESVLASGLAEGHLDIDGDGQYDALTDGMLVVRYLFGFRGTSLLENATGTGCSRCEASAVETYLSSLMVN